MEVQLLVERDQDECFVRLAGTTYKFRRNEHGHLITEINDLETIKWVSNPMHNTSFRPYSPPEPKAVPEAVTVEAGERAAPAEEPEPLAAMPEETEPEPEPEPKGMPCPICGKRFATPLKLRGHMGGAHRGA